MMISLAQHPLQFADQPILVSEQQGVLLRDIARAASRRNSATTSGLWGTTCRRCSLLTLSRSTSLASSAESYLGAAKRAAANEWIEVGTCKHLFPELASLDRVDCDRQSSQLHVSQQ